MEKRRESKTETLVLYGFVGFRGGWSGGPWTKASNGND